MINNGKKVFLSILLVFCIALTIVAAYYIGDYMEAQTANGEIYWEGGSSHISNAVYLDDELYLPRTEVRNYLIMGIDESGEIDDDVTGQVDFLLILSFDGTTKEYTMVSINRDTMVDVVEVDLLGNKRTVKKQIALSHSYTGSEGLTNKEKCLSTMDAASRIFHGMKFDGYMSMTMDAVDIMVDEFGGVEVYVEEDYTSVDPRLIPNTTVMMDGELAMKFVRMRGGLADSSNIARMKRQEAFLKAFFGKVGDRFAYESDLLNSYSKIEKYVYNSSGINGYDEIFWKLTHYEEGESVTLRGEALVGRGGYMEFYVDDTHVKEVIADVFYKKASK